MSDPFLSPIKQRQRDKNLFCSTEAHMNLTSGICMQLTADGHYV